jgi:catechol 2,3-dioxygenase-like lactoylglutathione lyase family enzyme
MPVIKVDDMLFGRLKAPDLDRMEEFLTDFGFFRVERTANKLFMRGTGADHHIHVTELGDPCLIGWSYQVADRDKLVALSKFPGATGIEHLDEPGGGERVCVTEPNGYRIEVIHGQARHTPFDVRRQEVNSVADPVNRAGDLMRIPKGPARPQRMAHAVLGTPRLEETVKWFRHVVGLISSDDVYAGEQSNLIGSFNRFDRGETFVDHHAFFCLRHEKTGLNHFSYEVQDIDDVFMGHEYLAAKNKYEHIWGIGRHVLGSQVYDYWADPWGRTHEHWADSDRLNATTPPNLVSADDGLQSQWGQRITDKMLERICP